MKLAMKVDNSYDDFFRSIGHCTAVCAILVALLDFIHIVILSISTLVFVLIYNSVHQKDESPANHDKSLYDDDYQYTKVMVAASNHKEDGLRSRVLRRGRSLSCPEPAYISRGNTWRKIL